MRKIVNLAICPSCLERHELDETDLVILTKVKAMQCKGCEKIFHVTDNQKQTLNIALHMSKKRGYN